MKRFFRKPINDAAIDDANVRTHEVRRLDISSMIDLAIEVWRLQERIKKMSLTIGKEDAASAFAMEKIREVFSQIGIEVRDFTGQAYNEGMSLDVLTSDYPAGENPPHKVFHESINRVCYFDGNPVKMSQVCRGKGG